MAGHGWDQKVADFGRINAVSHQFKMAIWRHKTYNTVSFKASVAHARVKGAVRDDGRIGEGQEQIGNSRQVALTLNASLYVGRNNGIIGSIDNCIDFL